MIDDLRENINVMCFQRLSISDLIIYMPPVQFLEFKQIYLDIGRLSPGFIFDGIEIKLDDTISRWVVKKRTEDKE